MKFLETLQIIFQQIRKSFLSKAWFHGSVTFRFWLNWVCSQPQIDSWGRVTSLGKLAFPYPWFQFYLLRYQPRPCSELSAKWFYSPYTFLTFTRRHASHSSPSQRSAHRKELNESWHTRLHKQTVFSCFLLITLLTF